MIALVGAEQVQHHVSQVKNQPTILRFTFDIDILGILLLREIAHSSTQCLEHAVTGAVTKDKEIRKGGYFVNIKQEDVLAFFFLEQINYCMCFF